MLGLAAQCTNHSSCVNRIPPPFVLASSRWAPEADVTVTLVNQTKTRDREFVVTREELAAGHRPSRRRVAAVVWEERHGLTYLDSPTSNPGPHQQSCDNDVLAEDAARPGRSVARLGSDDWAYLCMRAGHQKV